MINISKDDFIEYYKKHSGQETSEHFNISRSAITKYCHICNFNKKAWFTKFRDKQVIKLYNQQYSRNAIAKTLKISLSAVDRILHANNLKYKTSLDYPTKEDLFNYYILQNKTVIACVNKFNVGKKVIINRLKQYGITKTPDNYYQVLKANLPIEDIKNFYLIQDNSWRATVEHFNLSSRILNYLIKENNWHKLTKNPNNSQPNKDFATLLDSYNISYEKEFRLERKSFDFKVNNYLIEINPAETHNIDWSPFKKHQGKNKDYHKNKTLLANKYGYNCIHIWDWDSADKIIKYFLLTKQIKIDADNCLIQEIDAITAKIFIDINFIQPYQEADINLGLFYYNNLVAVMSFKKLLSSQETSYELINYCHKTNTVIINGNKVLFNYFLINHKPTSIISYCDKSKFSSKLYTNLNFKLITTSRPMCHWFRRVDNKHINNALVTKANFKKVVNTNDNKKIYSTTLMLKSNFLRLYDCGQDTYLYRN